MSPLHFMMQMSQTLASATLKAQSAWWDASLAATDKVTRAAEKPQDAANRAAANAEAGVSEGWYRAPPATWSEISDRAAGAHPANAMMSAAGWPMLFAPPFGGAAAFHNPFLEMMLSGPFAAPGIFDMMPGPTNGPANGKTLRPDGSSSLADEAARAGDVGKIGGASAGSSDGRLDAEAIPASPIEIIDTAPFWPWASGFGAVPHSAQPPIIENVASEDSDD